MNNTVKANKYEKEKCLAILAQRMKRKKRGLCSCKALFPMSEQVMLWGRVMENRKPTPSKVDTNLQKHSKYFFVNLNFKILLKTFHKCSVKFDFSKDRNNNEAT